MGSYETLMMFSDMLSVRISFATPTYRVKNDRTHQLSGKNVSIVDTDADLFSNILLEPLNNGHELDSNADSFEQISCKGSQDDYDNEHWKILSLTGNCCKGQIVPYDKQHCIMTFLENGEITNEDKGNYKISKLFYDILFAGIFLLIPIPINRYISLRLLWLMYTMGSYGAHTLNPVDNATVNSMSNETRSSHQLNYKELTRLLFNFHDYNKKEVQNNITITMD